MSFGSMSICFHTSAPQRFSAAATPSQGTYDPVRGLWSVGTLQNGGVATLTITARVVSYGTIVNAATAGADEIDPILANNLAAAIVVGLNPAPVITQRMFLVR